MDLKVILRNMPTIEVKALCNSEVFFLFCSPGAKVLRINTKAIITSRAMCGYGAV
jgi:hypothetical protein